MDILGWVTIDNQSGKAFADATIKLMAGDVNKLEPDEGARNDREMLLGAVSRAAGPAVTEKAFDEFHLYSLPLPTRAFLSDKLRFSLTPGVKCPAIRRERGSLRFCR